MTPCSPSHSQHRIHTMAIASRRHQTRAAGSTAVKIQELLLECGHMPQRFFDLDKFSELREHARIILFYAKARHRVGDAFLVPNRQLLLHLRAAIRDVHGSATCRPTRRHDLLEWCTATAPSMHGQELLFHFAGHFETCDKGSLSVLCLGGRLLTGVCCLGLFCVHVLKVVMDIAGYGRTRVGCGRSSICARRRRRQRQVHRG